MLNFCRTPFNFFVITLIRADGESRIEYRTNRHRRTKRKTSLRNSGQRDQRDSWKICSRNATLQLAKLWQYSIDRTDRSTSDLFFGFRITFSKWQLSYLSSNLTRDYHPLNCLISNGRKITVVRGTGILKLQNKVLSSNMWEKTTEFSFSRIRVIRRE